MRRDRRQQGNEEHGESAFVSMTDMTVSFLFIVMILLAFFASQYSEDAVPQDLYTRIVQDLDAARSRSEALQAENVKLKSDHQSMLEQLRRLETELALSKKIDPLEQYLAQTAHERRRILEALQKELQVDFPDLKVVISQESDALRFEGDGLFRSGASELRLDRRAIIEKIADRLEQILPCYTLGTKSAWYQKCNPGKAVIEAVQIEGHTDSDGSEINNLILSTARANTTFITMTMREAGLIEHRNIRGQPVLSVAGYGEMRPVAGNDNADSKATNRRIDLRIIMYTPATSGEIQKIRNELRRATKNDELIGKGSP